MCNSLTSSNNPFDSDTGDINLLGKLMDSLVGIFIGVGINIRADRWEFDCEKESKDRNRDRNEKLLLTGSLWLLYCRHWVV